MERDYWKVFDINKNKVIQTREVKVGSISLADILNDLTGDGLDVNNFIVYKNGEVVYGD